LFANTITRDVRPLGCPSPSPEDAWEGILRGTAEDEYHGGGFRKGETENPGNFEGIGPWIFETANTITMVA
jgi:hypothetical protein